MQSTGWSDLLARIPPEYLGNLMLVTATGLEIAIQALISVEEEYLVIKGRLAGTDFPRFLFMPFCRIDYLGFQKGVKEAEVRALFGAPMAETAPPSEEPAPETDAAAPPAPEEPPAAGPPPEPASPEPPTLPAPAPAPEATPVKKSLSPSDKKAMLERLRARVAAGVCRPDSSGGRGAN